MSAITAILGASVVGFVFPDPRKSAFIRGKLWGFDYGDYARSRRFRRSLLISVITVNQW